MIRTRARPEAIMTNLITRILVPTDFSRPSERALDYALDLAQQFGASLHLLHVVNRPLLAEGLAAEAFMSEKFESDMVRGTESRLRKLAPDAASTDVVFGYAAKAIVDWASRLGADLIVMGCHGRAGVAHLMLGSVAEAVVRTARCPVLTVRHSMTSGRVLNEHEAIQTAD
jgi:nucleotide-binding universal stress UspA family protein